MNAILPHQDHILCRVDTTLCNELLEDFDGGAEELLGKNGLLMQVKKRVVAGKKT
jgi:hypothetical protein